MKSIKLIQLRNGEYIQFLNSVLNIISADKQVKDGLRYNRIRLGNQVAKLEEVYLIMGNDLTAKIREADKKRDVTYLGLKEIIKGCLKHFDPILKSKAEIAMHVLKRYNLNVDELSYQTETENLKLLIDALYDLESKDKVLTSLNIIEWVDQLKVYNEGFNKLYLKRNTSYAKIGLTSVSAGRKETDKLYRDLIKVLDATIILRKKSFRYQKVRNQINTLITSYNDTIVKRKAQS